MRIRRASGFFVEGCLVHMLNTFSCIDGVSKLGRIREKQVCSLGCGLFLNDWCMDPPYTERQHGR